MLHFAFRLMVLILIPGAPLAALAQEMPEGTFFEYEESRAAEGIEMRIGGNSVYARSPGGDCNFSVGAILADGSFDFGPPYIRTLMACPDWPKSSPANRPGYSRWKLEDPDTLLLLGKDGEVNYRLTRRH